MKSKLLRSMACVLAMVLVFVQPEKAIAGSINDSEYTRLTLPNGEDCLIESYCYGSADGGIWTGYDLDIELNGYADSWETCEKISYSGSINITGIAVSISNTGGSISGSSSSGGSFSGEASNVYGLDWNLSGHVDAAVVTSAGFSVSYSYTYAPYKGMGKTVNHILSDSCLIW